MEEDPELEDEEEGVPEVGELVLGVELLDEDDDFVEVGVGVVVEPEPEELEELSQFKQSVMPAGHVPLICA